MSKLIVLFLTAGLVASGFSQTAPPREVEVERLLERIAAGEGVDACDAADELLALITGPLAAALDTFEPGALDRRRRVRAALSRLTAGIRARWFRATLPPDERKQLDRFAELNQPLIDQLFADDPARRIEAIGRIPIEIGSGAGVAATAGLYDHDESVIAAAFDSCREFAGDEFVGKGVTRFIDASIEAHQAGRYADAEVAMGVVIRVGEAIRVLGQLKYAPGVPSAVRAIRLYGTSDFRKVFVIGLGNNSDRSQPIDAL
ncbi:MAG: hypothetical protein IID33_08840, partial [Planctomycetes bacterium]|nr:hypothetical protein [Planctomycetota bacterium]